MCIDLFFEAQEKSSVSVMDVFNLGKAEGLPTKKPAVPPLQLRGHVNDVSYRDTR